MARSQRLLELIQVLRRYHHPVTGQALADELGISLRTIYRDVQTLIGQGAPIDGEAGLGFILRPGFVLPPLMFSDEELEALVLGLRWVAQRTDASFEHAAMNALAKIAAVLPDDLRNNVEGIGLIPFPSRDADAKLDLAPVRAAIRSEQMVVLGLSAFPHRPHHHAARDRQTLPPAPARSDETVARDRKDRRADLTSRC
jgi:predicted DNA-binding transcriptional regulator YafY